MGRRLDKEVGGEREREREREREGRRKEILAAAVFSFCIFLFITQCYVPPASSSLPQCGRAYEHHPLLLPPLGVHCFCVSQHSILKKSCFVAHIFHMPLTNRLLVNHVNSLLHIQMGICRDQQSEPHRRRQNCPGLELMSTCLQFLQWRIFQCQNDFKKYNVACALCIYLRLYLRLHEQHDIYEASIGGGEK